MLSAMRTGAKSILIKFVLFGLLVLATLGLAVMDVQGMFRQGSPKSYVATIGREKITSVEFDNLLQRTLQQQNIPQDEAYRMGIPTQVLVQEINTRLFGRAAHDFGIIIDNKAAAKQLKAIIAPLAKQGGMTEAEAFRRVLQNTGVSENYFVGGINGQMATDQLLKTIAAPARAPALMVNDALKYSAEWRRGEYFVLTAADAGAVGAPDEEDLKEHYESIASQFSLPEYRDFAVLVLDKDALGADRESAAASEETLKQHYDENIAEYTSPERRTIEQVVVSDEATARQIRDAAAAGQNLKKAAEDIAKGKSSFIRDTYAEADMPVELSAAFKARQGAVLEPVKTPLGWHVLYVDSITPSAVTPFEKAKDQIAKELAAEDSADALYDRANEIDDMIAGGKPLSEVAQSFGLKETVFTDVSSEGVNRKGDKVDAKLSVFPKIVQTAYALDEGEASQLIETPEGSFVIVEVRDIKPSQEQPLETVRSEVIESWKQKQKGILLDQQAAKIAEKLQLGESFEKLAASFGKRLESTGLVQRNSQPGKAGLERGLLPALFAMDKLGQTTNVAGEDKVTILRLAERKSDLPKDAKPEEVQAMQALLDRSLQNDILEQYRNYLMKEYDVEINTDVMARLYAPKDEGAEEEE